MIPTIKNTTSFQLRLTSLLVGTLLSTLVFSNGAKATGTSPEDLGQVGITTTKGVRNTFDQAPEDTIGGANIISLPPEVINNILEMSISFEDDKKNSWAI